MSRCCRPLARRSSDPLQRLLSRVNPLASCLFGSPTVDAVEQLLRGAVVQAQHAGCRCRVEVESRFGRFITRSYRAAHDTWPVLAPVLLRTKCASFVSGVSFATYNKATSLLEDSCGGGALADTLHLVCYGGRRLEMDWGRPSTLRMVNKQKDDTVELLMPVGHCDVRFAASSETEDQDWESSASTAFVRFSRRRVRRTYNLDPMLRVDLSKVSNINYSHFSQSSSGTLAEAAEALRKMSSNAVEIGQVASIENEKNSPSDGGETTYELEVEVDVTELLRLSKRSSACGALHSVAERLTRTSIALGQLLSETPS